MDLVPILGVAGVARLPTAQLPAFINQTHAGPDPANLLMQMCQVLLAMGQDEFALEMQAKALQHRRLYRLVGQASPTIRLLAVMGPGGMIDNTPLDFVVENLPVRIDLVFIGPDQDLPEEIPDHDIVMVAIGESAANASLLVHVDHLLLAWPRPVLNRPDGIARCARDAVWRVVADVPGLCMPPTWRITREETGGLRFPLTIRPVDLHAGEGLAKLDAPAELPSYLDSRGEQAFYLSHFVDYRSADGLYRKFRIALIDGQPYVCHLAISAHWIVHYFSAGMVDSLDKRLEESRQMASFDGGFGARHAAALQGISDALGLEYVVLDCAETVDGRLLLFEADSRGWIHATDPIDLFPYKPQIMQKAFDAFFRMLHRRLPRC